MEVRVSSLGKTFGNKLYDALRKEFPDKLCLIHVEERGKTLRIHLEHCAGETVDLKKAEDIISPLVHRQVEDEFDGGSWCSFYYSYA